MLSSSGYYIIYCTIFIILISLSSFPIKVVIQEGHHQIGIELDDGLIQFGTAIDDGDFVRAITYLESIGESPEAEAMWRTLANLSLELKQLRVAERCFGALGDIAKTHYLKETIEIGDEYAANYGNCFIFFSLIFQVYILISRNSRLFFYCL